MAWARTRSPVQMMDGPRRPRLDARNEPPGSRLIWSELAHKQRERLARSKGAEMAGVMQPSVAHHLPYRIGKTLLSPSW